MIASAIPSHRTGPTCSLRKNIASNATKTGPMRLTAVASATGIRLSAVNQDSIDAEFRKARPTCQWIFGVRSTPKPIRRKIGMNTSSPRKLRKNATSNGCSPSTWVTWRMVLCMVAKKALAITTSNTPRTPAGIASSRAFRPFTNMGRALASSDHPCMARQTLSGVAGMSMLSTPNSANASTTAFMTAGSAPLTPASPAPLAPSTLVFAGTG